MKIKTFSEIVDMQVTVIQSLADRVLNFAVGRVIRALIESNSTVAVWIQSMILDMLLISRASTSKGADLDSWMADFGFYREEATYASGEVTLGRFTGGLVATVPIGSKVEVKAGPIYTIIADNDNPAYDADAECYVLQAADLSVNVSVIADVAGESGNVDIGFISVLTQPLPGIDTVTNLAKFTNGVAAEDDAAFRVRFVKFLQSLARGTVAAISYAIASVQANIQYALFENETLEGLSDLGYFTVVIDNGTGDPGADLIETVAGVVDGYRPICTTFGVFGPTVTNATVIASLTAKAGYNATTVRAVVKTVIEDHISSLSVGRTLDFSRLLSICYNVEGVDLISLLTINGASASLVPGTKGVVRFVSVTVT